MVPTLFEDEIISSSELNRRSGEVLKMAETHPVTIARPSGDLVLMRRSLAGNLTQLAEASQDLLDLCCALLGACLSAEKDTGWAYSLTLEQLTSAVTEVSHAARRDVTLDQRFKAAAAMVHEWAESTRWANNQELNERVATAEAAYADGGGLPAPSPDSTENAQ